MTELQWLSSTDLLPMLEAIQGKASDRQMRLLLAGGARLIWNELTDPLLRAAVEVSERHADGHATNDELQAVQSSLFRAYCEWGTRAGERWQFQFGRALIATFQRANEFNTTAWKFAVSQKGDDYAHVLREIIGNPFRPATISPECLCWHDGTVPKIARLIYEEKRFDAMPVLGDAMEEAGSLDMEIHRHCRQPGVHVRGCWVLDLILRLG